MTRVMKRGRYIRQMTTASTNGGGQADLRSLVDSLSCVPAFVQDRYLTVVAANRLARALSPAYLPGTNLARFAFIESGPASDSEEWDETLANVSAALKDSLEQHEEDRRFLELVGELSARSRTFAELWASDTGPVRYRGAVTFRLSRLRTLGLSYQALRLPDDFDSVVVAWRPRDDEQSRDDFGRFVRSVT